LNRFIKYTNYLIAFVLAVCGGLVYWFAYRVLPQTSGTVGLPVSAAARVVRDAQGVPHIYAASEEDAWFLQGYCAAQDRLFQIEMFRRLAAGEIAAILGPQGVEPDLDARRFRIRRLAEQHLRTLRDEDRAPIAAFARGVNAFIERNRGALPVEFSLARFDPSPWTVTDSVMVALSLTRNLTNTWRDEATKQAMRSIGDPKKVDFLFPVRTGDEISMGSNAWAISGARTASGKPLLANDPHLQTAVPGLWYQVHLKTPQVDVAGVQLPGLPGVLIGHNQRIAWGMTILHYDVQDLYEVRGGPVAQERETVAVRGGRPVDAVLLVTRHGPVITNEGGRNYAVRWAAALPGWFEYPVAELNRAGNWEEFRAALKRYPGAGANFLYADVDGNIGYQAAGKLPARKTWNGDLPAGPDDEWDGLIAFEDLPSAFNPPSGMLISSNQNPFPANYRHRVHGNFAAPYRARQARAMLSRQSGWTAARMAQVQKDVYSAPAHFLARQLAGVARSRGAGSPQIAEAGRLLEAWNGQMNADLPQPFIVILVFQHLRKAILEHVAPDKGAQYDSQMGQAIIERLFRDRPAGWFADYDQVLAKALLDALEEGERIQGRNPANWKWGAYNVVRLDHPVVGRIPLLGPRYRWGPQGLDGAPNVISTTTARVSPSMRFIADLADWEKSTLTLAGGQSGQPMSGNYRDQWEKWLAGDGIPMRFGAVEGRVLEVHPGK